jgi:hypothetical protein
MATTILIQLLQIIETFPPNYLQEYNGTPPSGPNDGMGIMFDVLAPISFQYWTLWLHCEHAKHSP